MYIENDRIKNIDIMYLYNKLLVNDSLINKHYKCISNYNNDIFISNVLEVIRVLNKAYDFNINNDFKFTYENLININNLLKNILKKNDFNNNIHKLECYYKTNPINDELVYLF